MPSFQQCIDVAYIKANPEKPRTHLGISGIGGDCLRAVWYSFRHATKVNHPGRIRRLFDYGHDFEPVLKKWLENAGFMVLDRDPSTGRQFHVTDPDNKWLQGSLDFIVCFTSKVLLPPDGVTPGELYVLDAKTVKDSAFMQFQNLGLELWRGYYMTQLNMYCGFSGQLGAPMPINKTILLSLNKNDHRIEAEINEFSPIKFDLTRTQAKNVVTGRIPDRRYKTPMDYQCRVCDHRDICHGSKIPELNCRTCYFSEFKLTGEMLCKRHGEIRTPAESLGVCDDHLFDPDIMHQSYGDAVFDSQKNAMFYNNFINANVAIKEFEGLEIFTSAALYLFDRSFQAETESDIDELIKEINNRFGYAIINRGMIGA